MVGAATGASEQVPPVPAAVPAGSHARTAATANPPRQPLARPGKDDQHEGAAAPAAAAALLTSDAWGWLYPHAVPWLYVPLMAACDAREITTPQRLAAFLAQWAHESRGFSRMNESFAYSEDRLVAVFKHRLLPHDVKEAATKLSVAARALRSAGPKAVANRVYANRNGNGSEESGDGYRYRGRGIPQLTGRGNYRAAGQALGLPLEEQPELAAEPKHSAQIAAWYWHRGGCNAMADADNFRGITRCINGGLNGLPDREREWSRARLVLGLPALP